MILTQSTRKDSMLGRNVLHHVHLMGSNCTSFDYSCVCRPAKHAPCDICTLGWHLQGRPFAAWSDTQRSLLFGAEDHHQILCFSQLEVFPNQDLTAGVLHWGSVRHKCVQMDLQVQDWQNRHGWQAQSLQTKDWTFQTSGMWRTWSVQTGGSRSVSCLWRLAFLTQLSRELSSVTSTWRRSAASLFLLIWMTGKDRSTQPFVTFGRALWITHHEFCGELWPQMSLGSSCMTPPSSSSQRSGCALVSQGLKSPGAPLQQGRWW